MLIQLSGVPGSGKSMLARGLARVRSAVVVDTDVLKSSLLASGTPIAEAGSAAYKAALDLAADLLAQGHEVVVDSPCRYPALLARGQQVAEEARVPYRFVELWTDDPVALLPRLDARDPRPSQVASAADPVPGTTWELGTPADTLRGWQSQLVRPESGWLRVDALAAPDMTLRQTLAYLASG